MITRIITSKVRKELEKLNFQINGELMPYKVCGDIWFLKIYEENKSYVVKYDDSNQCKFDKEKELLEKYGIKTIQYVVCGSNIILYEDIEQSEKYRFANKDDLNNDKVIFKLAKWYKLLHDIKNNSNNICDYFTLFNLKQTMKKLNVVNNEAFMYICNNYDNIKLKIDRLQKCFVYGGFSLENVVVSKDFDELFMINFDNKKYGYRYFDIKEILLQLNQEKKNVFIKNYGKINEDEIAVDNFLSTYLKLYFAAEESVFPSCARKEIDSLYDGKFLKCVKSLVEWY